MSPINSSSFKHSWLYSLHRISIFSCSIRTRLEVGSEAETCLPLFLSSCGNCFSSSVLRPDPCIFSLQLLLYLKKKTFIFISPYTFCDKFQTHSFTIFCRAAQLLLLIIGYAYFFIFLSFFVTKDLNFTQGLPWTLNICCQFLMECHI